MLRPSATPYRTQMAVLMMFYVLLTALVLPLARAASALPWKVALALLPTLPIIAAVWLMANMIMASDELEQRLHLIALSVATGVVGTLSLIGGFLCAVGAIALDGDVLIWIFPALSLIYGATHWLAARRYGILSCG